MKLLTPPLVGRNWMDLAGKNFDAASLCRAVPSEKATEGAVAVDIESDEPREGGKDDAAAAAADGSSSDDRIDDFLGKKLRENELTLWEG